MLNSRINILLYPSSEYKEPKEFEFTIGPGPELKPNHRFFRMFLNLKPESIRETESDFVTQLSYIMSF